MARIRTIKPDFWTDETLTECSLSARLLFIGSWNFADDNGNLEHSAKQLKMKVFPADDVKVTPLLNDLITHGLLIEYSVNGKKYLHIKGFEKHQVINRPSISDIPPFDESLRTPLTLTEDSLREGNGMEGKGIIHSSTDPSNGAGKKKRPSTFRYDYPEDFMQFWSRYPRRENKPQAHKEFEFEKRNNPKFTQEKVLQATTAYAEEVSGKESGFIKMPSTFLHHGTWLEKVYLPEEATG